MNDFQCQRLLQRILSLFGDSLLGVKVAFLGFSYKSGTGDEKGNLAKHLIQKLLTYGAEVSIHDPLVSRHDIFSELALDRPPPGDELKGDKVEIRARPYDACCEAELVVITTDAAAYRALRWDGYFHMSQRETECV
jgi:UDPglucose 6-dehydrogenase